MISAVVRSPAGSSSRPGSATKQSGASSATRRKRRSRLPATPRPRTSGVIEADQLHQAAHERDPGGRRAPARHLALVQLTRARRERPVVLADDHDAVRTGHAAELRQRGCAVGACENVGDECVHLHMVAEKRPPGECRTAYPPRGAAYLVAAAAEKAQQGKHEHDDQDDPEQAHSCSFRDPVASTALARRCFSRRPKPHTCGCDVWGSCDV